MATEPKACENTDRELWREVPGNYYSAKLFITANGTVGIDVDGLVIVRPIRSWHALAQAEEAIRPLPVVDQ